jgi:hypothetical protein
MAYTSASRAHTHPNKTVKLSASYILSMTSCVLSYFRLVYRLIFGLKLFITPLTFLIASPPKPLVHPPQTLLFITRTLTIQLFMFLVVFATPTPLPLCLINSRLGLVLVFFLVIHLIIRVIATWTLPLSESLFLAMLFLTGLLFPLPHRSLPLLPLTSFLTMFLLSSFLRLSHTILQGRLCWRPPRCLPRHPPHHLRRCPLRRLHRRHPWRPCIARAAPPASMSIPMSGLTCMFLSTGTRRFPPPHVRHSRIPTGSRL